MKEIVILELTSRNIQQAFIDHGLGPNDAAECLRDLFSHAHKMIKDGGDDYNKGIKLLQFCYEKLESFVRHIEGGKVEMGEKSQGVEEMSGEELERLLYHKIEG